MLFAFFPGDTDAQSWQMCCYGNPGLTQVAAPWVIPKGKWSWMSFGSVILFNTPTPGVGAVAILMLFFPAWLTEPLHPPLFLLHLLSWQVPGWMGHHRNGDWGDDTRAHTNSHRQKWGEWVTAQSHTIKSCPFRGETAVRIELSLEANSVWKWTDLSSYFTLSKVNLSFG